MVSVPAATEAVSLAREPRRLHALFVRYPMIAGAFAACVGLIVEVGWVAHLRHITHPFAHVSMMRPHTAAMVVLIGIALALTPCAARAPWARVVSRSTALAVTVLALFALGLYAAHVTVNTSRGSLLALLAHGFAARSPYTAFTFALLSVALLALDRRAGARFVSDYLAIAVLVIAMAALLGYLFEAPALYGRPGEYYIAMSPVTAALAFVLALGVMTLHLERGVLSVVLARDAGGVVARQLLLGLVVFPPAALIIVLGTRAGWYALPLASALVLLLALGESSVFALRTAERLSQIDGVQRRVNEDLRASESRMRSLVEDAKDAIFVANLDGRYIEVNPAASELLGYSREELLRMSIADLLPSEDAGRLVAERATVMAGSVARGEWMLRRRDGTLVPVEVVAHVLPDQRWQAIVRDISDRERNARLLEQAFAAERQARADLETVVAARARIAEVVAHLTTEDIQPVLAVITDQLRALTHAEFAAVGVGVDPTKPYDYWVTTTGCDELVRTLGDRPRPIDVLGVLPHHPAVPSFLATPITRGAHVVGMLYIANKQAGEQFTDRDSRLVGLLSDGVALGIEAARGFAAEAAQRLWLQSVIDQFPEGVAVLDAKGGVFMINRTAKAWTFSPAKEGEVGALAQFDLLDIDGKAIPPTEFPVVRALATGRRVPEQEFQLRLPDGQLIPIEACAAPVRDQHGELVGAVGTGRDLSERKELERLRDEWIAVVAHDLRQPIHTIVFSLELLSDLGDETRKLVLRLQNTAFQLNRMIDDLLDAARISANRLTVDPTPNNLVSVVHEAIDHMQITEPSVTITLAAPDELIAWIDPGRIQQVLGNLLSNAVKYRTPDTEVHVEVRGDETGARVAVSNEGPTLDAEEQQRIFGRFVRGQSGPKKRGIGLGLYICKGLVEAHGGEIHVSSDAGHTRFSFTLPAQPVALGRAPESPPQVG